MLTKNLFQGAALSIAAVAAGFAGTSASAGGCSYGGGYSGGYHGGGGYSNSGYTHRTRAVRTSRRSTHHNHVTTVHHDVRQHGNHQHVEERVTRHTEPAGYYRRVYRAPVYRTYYDACGYPYRVQVRAGYYDRVWVDYGH